VTPPTIAEVRGLIQRAFAGTARPTESEIALHECDECRAVRAALAPHEWETIPDVVVAANQGNLPLLSAKALAYYLPAYLLYSLRHFSPWNNVADSTVSYLAFGPPSNEDSAAWRREKLRGFTAEQIDAASAFLLLVEADAGFRTSFGDTGPGRRRLRQFWVDRWDG
jgi:hypothetical protein